MILENLKIEASRGIQINNDGYTRVEVNNTEMQALSYHGWCLQISNAVEGNTGVDILVDGGDLFSAQGYVIECNGDAEVSIKNAKLGGAAGILMQGRKPHGGEYSSCYRKQFYESEHPHQRHCIYAGH